MRFRIEIRSKNCILQSNNQLVKHEINRNTITLTNRK